MNVNAIENPCFICHFLTLLSSFCVRGRPYHYVDDEKTVRMDGLYIIKFNLCTHAILLWRINTFLSATEILAYILLTPELVICLHYIVRGKANCTTSANKSDHLTLHFIRNEKSDQLWFLDSFPCVVFFPLLSFIRQMLNRHCFEILWADSE